MTNPKPPLAEMRSPKLHPWQQKILEEIFKGAKPMFSRPGCQKSIGISYTLMELYKGKKCCIPDEKLVQEIEKIGECKLQKIDDTDLPVYILA